MNYIIITNMDEPSEFKIDDLIEFKKSIKITPTFVP